MNALVRDPGRGMGFREFLQTRPMLLDAGMGIRLMALGLDLKSTDPSAWNLAKPSTVRSIHEADRSAGADAVYTNSFGAHHQAAVDRDWITAASVQLAREAIGPQGFVIASLGPRSGWKDGDCRQVDVFLDNGVDAVALETCKPEEALEALRSIRHRVDLPILVSVFLQPEPGFWRMAEEEGADALGVNCVSDLALIGRILEEAAEVVRVPLLVKPSAGLPGTKPLEPSAFAVEVRGWLNRGVRLMGGCCGTTERHIARLRQALDAESPGFRPDKIDQIGL